MKNLEFLKSNLIAHRGFHNKEIPENSIKAFKRAIKNNYTIEFDIHLLKDNEIIVFHDDNLKRMTKLDKEVKNVTLKEIKKLKLLETKEKIPTLKEVLKLINGKVPIVIELKCDNKAGLLEKELVKLLDDYDGLFCVKSFNPLTVRWFKKNRPNYIRGLLLTSKKNKFIKKLMPKFLIYLFCKPDFLSCDYKLYKKKFIRKNIPVISWTIKNKTNYSKYRKHFDNLICENIDTFK